MLVQSKSFKEFWIEVLKLQLKGKLRLFFSPALGSLQKTNLDYDNFQRWHLPC